jgi:hypothetical protein
VQEPIPAGPSKLPLYLAIAAVVLGFAAYLSSFGGVVDSESGSGGAGLALGLLFSLGAALLGGVSLLPKQKDHTAIVAVLSVLGFLLIIAEVINSSASFAWPAYLILAFSVLQAIAAVGALLLDAGVITAPVPRPKYEQHSQYNPYGAGPSPYYGQPQQPQQPDYGQPQQPQQPDYGQPHQPQQPDYGQSQRPEYGQSQPTQHLPQPPQQSPQQSPQAPAAAPQRPGFSPQYGAYPDGPSTVNFTPSTPLVGQSGPPTPPTGFPAYGQPQPSAPPTQVISQKSPPQSPSSPQPPEDESAPPPS